MSKCIDCELQPYLEICERRNHRRAAEPQPGGNEAHALLCPIAGHAYSRRGKPVCEEANVMIAAGRARGIEEGEEAVTALLGIFREARARWIEISCGRTLTADEAERSRACDLQVNKWERIADAIAKETK